MGGPSTPGCLGCEQWTLEQSAETFRIKADPVVHTAGRDVEEPSITLFFAADIDTWQLLATRTDEVILN